MKVFITGSSGFIGRTLTEVCIQEGLTVDTLVDGETGELLDLRDAKAVSTSVINARPDVIIHLAGVSGPMIAADDPAFVTEVNCTGTANLVKAAEDAGVKRFVYAASLSGYDTGGIGSTGPATVYGATKRYGEMLTGIFGSATNRIGVSARISAVYGPGRETVEVLDRMVLEAKGTGTVTYRDDAIIPLISVRDVSESLMKLAVMDNPPRECDLVTQTMSELALARMVSESFELPDGSLLRSTGPVLPLSDWRRTVFPELLLSHRPIETLPGMLSEFKTASADDKTATDES